MGQRRTNGSGFTLVELMIVIVILAVAAAIVVPMASSAATMQLRSAVNMVAADLEYAKSLSIGTGQRHSVVFNTGTHSYRIINTATAATVAHPVKKGFSYEISFANDGRLDQVHITSANFDGPATVTFDYLGSPYNAKATPGPLDSGSVVLEAGGVQRTITVEPVTGFITISD